MSWLARVEKVVVAIYSVFIDREESGKEGEFLRQNPGCNRWP